MKKRIFYIYVLQLKENRFYIGYTKNYKKRLNKHNNINNLSGSVYVHKYLPIKVFKVVKIIATKWEAETYENIITIYFGSIYGYKNVRGGNFTRNEDDITENMFFEALQKRKIQLNHLEITINRIDIIRNFNNSQDVYNQINLFNLGTEVTEQQ